MELLHGFVGTLFCHKLHKAIPAAWEEHAEDTVNSQFEHVKLHMHDGTRQAYHTLCFGQCYQVPSPKSRSVPIEDKLHQQTAALAAAAVKQKQPYWANFGGILLDLLLSGTPWDTANKYLSSIHGTGIVTWQRNRDHRSHNPLSIAHLSAMRRLLHKVWNILTASSKKSWSQPVCQSETETTLTATRTLHLPVHLQLHLLQVLLQVLLCRALLCLLVHQKGHPWQVLPADAVLVGTAFQTRCTHDNASVICDMYRIWVLDANPLQYQAVKQPPVQVHQPLP